MKPEPGKSSPELLQCDVCRKTSTVFYLYANANFIVIHENGDAVDVDEGHWALCQRCHDLLDVNNYSAIANACFEDSPGILADLEIMRDTAFFFEQLAVSITGPPDKLTREEIREKFYTGKTQ